MELCEHFAQVVLDGARAHEPLGGDLGVRQSFSGESVRRRARRSHSPYSSSRFNTGGIESAVKQAKSLAERKDVALGSPSITQQCLDLGLLDRIQVSLVPLLLGSGIRLFENLATAPIELEGPTVSEGNLVTHLSYRVARSDA